MEFTTEDVITSIIEILEEKKTRDITIVDIREVMPIADYFVIGTIQSAPQARSIVMEIDKKMREFGLIQIKRRNIPQKDWMLLDYNDFILHLFTEEKREFYNLEGLWGKHVVEKGKFRKINGSPGKTV